MENCLRVGNTVGQGSTAGMGLEEGYIRRQIFWGTELPVPHRGPAIIDADGMGEFPLTVGYRVVFLPDPIGSCRGDNPVMTGQAFGGNSIKKAGPSPRIEGRHAAKVSPPPGAAVPPFGRQSVIMTLLAEKFTPIFRPQQVAPSRNMFTMGIMAGCTGHTPRPVQRQFSGHIE